MDTAEIERELDDLETRIDRLRALYEQYFLGIEKMEPSIPRRDAERKIQILRKEQVRNTAQRFKFQMLVQRYNTMQQHWARVTREIENGTYRRDVMRAAARFGEKEALTILGKKRQKQYSVLAEAQAEAQALRKRRSGEDDELELSDSDLLVEDDDGPQQSAVARSPIASGDPGSSEHKAKLGGLRWSGKSASDPASAVRSTEAQTGVKRRLAELAAAMKTPAASLDEDEDPPTLPPRAMSTPTAVSGVRPESAGFGSLDLDFDDSAAAPRGAPLRKPGMTAAVTGGATIPGSTGVRPVAPSVMPGASALRPPTPPSDASGPRTPAPFSPRTPAPVAPQAPTPSSPPAASPSFGALDLPFDAPPMAAPPRRSLPPPVAPPARASIPPAPRPLSPPTSPSRAAPAPSAATPAPSAAAARSPAAATDGSLPDQRLRQIYAKYVEAKRSANESTAGVTYEKLAETLRAQASRLKASHPAKSVDYDVVIKDGKTLLKPVLR